MCSLKYFLWILKPWFKFHLRYVTLGKLLNLSVPQFPLCKMGHNNIHFIGLW